MLNFEKIHGCGNDFVIIDNIDNTIHLDKEKIENICNRHFGIGADGLILVEKKDGNYFMNYYNSDGSTAEMCGNGMRCTADFIKRHHLKDEDSVDITSRAGMHHINFSKEGIRVSLDKAKTIEIDTKKLTEEIGKLPVAIEGPVGFRSMGNPHMVIVVDDLETFPINTVGPFFERNPLFPEGINVNFVKIKSPEEIEVITWERGDGRTLACGTGACASAAFLKDINKIKSNAKVNLPGGALDINLEEDKIYMIGPAKKVFTGEIEV